MMFARKCKDGDCPRQNPIAEEGEEITCGECLINLKLSVINSLKDVADHLGVSYEEGEPMIRNAERAFSLAFTE